jgi:hypothetical protein
MDDQRPENDPLQFQAENNKRARETASEVPGVTLTPATMDNIRQTALLLHDPNYAADRSATSHRTESRLTRLVGGILSSATMHSIRLATWLRRDLNYASNSAATSHRTESDSSTPLPQAVIRTKGVLEGQMKRVKHWATTRCSSEAQALLTEPLLCKVVCGAAVLRGTAAIESLDPDDARINHAVLKSVADEIPEAGLSLDRLRKLLEVARGRVDTPPPEVVAPESPRGRISGGVVNVPEQNGDEGRDPSLKIKAEAALVVAVRKDDGRLELCTRTSVGQSWNPELPPETDFHPVRHLIVNAATPDKVQDYRIYEVVPPQTPFGAVVACDAVEASQLVWDSMTWQEHAREPAADSVNPAAVKPYFCVVGAELATASASPGSGAKLDDITVMGPVSDLRTVHVLAAKPQNDDRRKRQPTLSVCLLKRVCSSHRSCSTSRWMRGRL